MYNVSRCGEREVQLLHGMQARHHMVNDCVLRRVPTKTRHMSFFFDNNTSYEFTIDDHEFCQGSHSPQHEFHRRLLLLLRLWLYASKKREFFRESLQNDYLCPLTRYH